jgi:hypothetical protein
MIPLANVAIGVLFIGVGAFNLTLSKSFRDVPVLDGTPLPSAPPGWDRHIR